MSDATHTVKHTKLYMRVNDKMEHFKAGTPLKLNAEQAKKMGSRVEAISTAEVKDLTAEEKKASK